MPEQNRRSPASPEYLRDAELGRALKLLRGGAPAAQIAESLSRRLTNKLLHAPTKDLAP